MDNTLHLLPITYYQLPVTWYLLPASNRPRDTCLKALRDIEWQKKSSIEFEKLGGLGLQPPFSVCLVICCRRGYHKCGASPVQVITRRPPRAPFTSKLCQKNRCGSKRRLR